MSKAWVVGSCATASFFGLVNKVSGLMREKGHITQAILTNPDLSEVQAGQLKNAGADTVYRLPLDIGNINCEKQAVNSLAAFYQAEKPDYILFESSVFFAAVAPSFAATVDCGITADCTDIAWDDNGNLLQIRPAFGGRKLASNINVRGTAIATVRKGVFHMNPPKSAESCKIKLLPVCSTENLWNGTERFLDEIKTTELCDAKVIVSGGLGMRSRENFAKLYRLAELMGAAVGASRAAVAAGFAGYDHQVGQTGVSVRPDLYIAFGISGAVQHLSGIMGAKKIIAVNSDPNAPIHRYSELSVVADCSAVVDALIEKLEKEKVRFDLA